MRDDFDTEPRMTRLEHALFQVSRLRPAREDADLRTSDRAQQRLDRDCADAYRFAR